MKTYLQDLLENGCQQQTWGGFGDLLTSVPLDSLPYSQSTRRVLPGRPEPVRLDCSGWASYVANADLSGPGSWGGYSTATLATYGVMYPIPVELANVGDYLGLMGPGSDASGGGGGHVAPIEGRTGSTFMVRDHGGGKLGDGPNRRNVQWASTSWAKQAWRYAFQTGATPPTLQGVADGLYEYKAGMWGGPVRDIQKVVGATVDGEFGDITAGKVMDWQGRNGLTVDGIVGPKTASKMLPLFSQLPTPEPEPTPTPTPTPVTLTEARVQELIAQAWGSAAEALEDAITEAITARVFAIFQTAGQAFADAIPAK